MKFLKWPLSIFKCASASQVNHHTRPEVHNGCQESWVSSRLKSLKYLLCVHYFYVIDKTYQ